MVYLWLAVTFQISFNCLIFLTVLIECPVIPAIRLTDNSLLCVKDELSRIRIIFGGGEYCDNPYKRAVIAPFTGQLFREPISPDINSIPPPPDLELQDNQKRWMRRLSVAYGLAFEKNELACFIYPKDVKDPLPEEIWKPQRIISEAPSKDQC